VIRFLLKGLLRDRHRSLFPILIVAIGVMLTVLLHCWIEGAMGDMIEVNAKFSTGHVKVVSRAYAEIMDQVPNDLALVGVAALADDLRRDFPDLIWVRRIRFGGLVDVPDEQGETRAQGPAAGLAVDMLPGEGSEIGRLNLERALTRGRLPRTPEEILLSDEFAAKLGLRPGDAVTLLSATMHGSMAMQNFALAGTVQFGVQAMDRGAVIVDLSAAQQALDMEDAAGEILGYFADGFYDEGRAGTVAAAFNARHAGAADEFAPIMLKLSDQNDLAGILQYASSMSGVLVAGFVLTMSIVLWNAGLIGGLRRYGEIGVRLAIGEDKGHVYRAMVWESVAIGLSGSVLGTLVGLGFAYLLQTKGVDVSSMMKNSTMMIPAVFRAHITDEALYIGFFPGLLATVLGSMLAGGGVYRRKTAQLFKELEA